MKCFVFLMVLAVAKAAVVPASQSVYPYEGESTDCQCVPTSECPQINEADSQLLHYIRQCEGDNMVCCPTPEIDTAKYNAMCQAANSKSPFPDARCCGRQVFNYSKASSEDRIYGGLNSQPEQHPWMVRIFTKNRDSSICGGFLVGSRHVLTAHHCVYTNGIKKTEVGLGCGDSCEQYIKYKAYHTMRDGWRVDIAILKLAEEVTFSNKVRPICLPAAQQAWSAKSLDTPREFEVSGWGKTEVVNNEQHKMYAIIHEKPHQECGILMRTMCKNGAENRGLCDQAKMYDYKLQGHLICAGSNNGNTCQGDSGGSLMQRTESSRYEAVGITTETITAGRACDEKEASLPHIFIDINEHMDWITKTITKVPKNIKIKHRL